MKLHLNGYNAYVTALLATAALVAAIYYQCAWFLRVQELALASQERSAKVQETVERLAVEMGKHSDTMAETQKQVSTSLEYTMANQRAIEIALGEIKRINKAALKKKKEE